MAGEDEPKPTPLPDLTGRTFTTIGRTWKVLRRAAEKPASYWVGWKFVGAGQPDPSEGEQLWTESLVIGYLDAEERKGQAS